jgi:hypothetical protein
MTVESIVLKRYKPFKLGFCLCGCNTEFTLRNKMHYLRRFQHGHNLPSGDKHHNWVGGKWTDKDGYILVSARGHPHARYGGQYMRQHILIYEHYLKILFDEDVYIPKGQEIHHINKVKSDNSLVNLTCIEHREHSKLHWQLRSEQSIGDNNAVPQAHQRKLSSFL